jgi:putative endonuclease
VPAPTPAYFVYIVRNRAGILYTGIAKDVDARCLQHNEGCGARFTRGRGPWIVVHTEGPFAHGDALRRELRIKADRRLKAAIKANAMAGVKRPARRGAG